jgi:hypothetical protein
MDQHQRFTAAVDLVIEAAKVFVSDFTAPAVNRFSIAVNIEFT